MNCIEDERIKFYLKHEDRIKEWVAIKDEVAEFAHRFYLSLRDDIDKAVCQECLSPNWEAESCVRRDENSKWPFVGLRRKTWPEIRAGEFSPKIIIEWQRKKSGFSPGRSYCGAHIGHVEEPEQFNPCGDSDGRENVPSHILKKYKKGANPSWCWWRDLDSPDRDFWKGDGLVVYRKQLLDQLLEAWTDLAPLMDEAAMRASEAAKRADKPT